MGDDDDITRNNHGGDEFSEAAHESIRPSKAVLRARVAAYVGRCGIGATCDEVEAALGMTHQTASPRFTELKASGALVWEGGKRRTRSGRWARVYVVASQT